MKKTVLRVLVSILALFACLCLTLYAAENDGGNVTSIYDVSPSAFKLASSLVLNEFTETNEGWDCEGSVFNVTVSESISAFPGTPLNGGGSLVCRVPSAVNKQKYYVSKSYPALLDLSAYSFFMTAVNCPETEGAEYLFTLEMYSDSDVFVAVDRIAPEGWNGVFVDISDWESRGGIKKIRMSVSFDGAEAPVEDFEYYVDSILLSNKTAPQNRTLFSADFYNISGGIGGFADGALKINSVGDELTLESNGFGIPAGGYNALRIDLKTGGLCQNVRAFIKTSDGYSEAGCSAVDAYNGNGEASVNVPLTGAVEGEIKLVFEGVALDYAEIYRIVPSFVFDGAGEENGGIDTCAVNPNTKELIIKGNIGRETAEAYMGREIYLFSADLCDEVVPEGQEERQSLESGVITSEDFIFRLKYTDKAEGLGLLFKQYAVAVKLDDGYRLIGIPVCVTNPESLSDLPAVASEKSTGKGIYGESIAFMQEVGASDTLVRVDIGSFFAQGTEKGIGFECGGNLFYYDSGYYSVIDTMIRNYAEKGIDVTLLFVVSDTGDSELNRLLIHKNADLSAEYCAFNTADRQGLSYLRAVSAFFAEKYCGNGMVTRVVFGDCVGNCGQTYNMGGKNVVEFAEQYADGLRVVYNAVRSVCPTVGVYTYIDNNWNRGFPADHFARYDNSVFLSALDERVSAEGDIAWGLAHDAYLHGKTDYFSYEDGDSVNSVFSRNAGFKNIGVPVNYLKSRDLLYNGSVRDYIIIEQTDFSALSEEQITADYVYNCYKALNTLVSAYITDRNCNYNNALKYVDTTLSFTASSFVSDVLGVSTWESVIEGFQGKNIEKRRIQTGDIRFSLPEHSGSFSFFDYTVLPKGLTRYGFTEKITAGAVFSGRTGLLSLLLGDVPDGEARGIVTRFERPVDMSHAPILTFEVNIASLPVNVDYSNITVILTSGNDYYEYTGKIRDAAWTKVCCDFSDFYGISKVDSVRILFYAEENYYDSPQVLLTPITWLSEGYDDQKLAELYGGASPDGVMTREVKTAIYYVLGGVSVLCAVILIIRRTAKTKKPTFFWKRK